MILAAIPALALSPAEESKVKDVAHEFIKDHLKAPATAIFSKESICAPAKGDFDEAKGTGPTPECKSQTSEKVGDGPDSVVYRGSVDAQNSYAALIRTKFQLRIFFSKEKWTVMDEAVSVKLMKDVCLDLNNAIRTLHTGKPIRDCEAEFPNAK